MSSQSLAIIGSGTFGLSTALAWRKTHPSAPITLIDTKPLPNTPTSPNQILPASEDIGKIIRAAYASPVYASLGREALAIWRTEKPYKDFFHASGWITANALAGDISISEGARIERGRFDEAFPDSRLDDRYVISEDEDLGWVEASRCLEAVRKIAVDQGVEYCVGEAVELLWEGKRCAGVKMRDGREIRAENVLVATGAWTPGFLQQCGVVADISSEVAGVTTVGIELDEDQYGKYRDMPILAVPGEGDIMPPDRNRIIKINNATSFLAPDISNHEVSDANDSPYCDENLEILLKFLPGLRSAPITFRRYCFDLVTMPAQDFILSAVPDLQGLYIAAGGSFHGWKFLPNIGGYVVRMIEGTLDNPWAELWRVGGTPSEDPVHRDLVPKRPFA